MIMINWVERLNYALAYIDNNLCDEIDFNEISRITACPVETLQRFFVLNTGITLTEYIRRRKLYESFNELKTTNNKIIDIAVKYGYNSPDAFSVAFKRIYGVAPAIARNIDITVKPFLRMIFSLNINYIQGEKVMKNETLETNIPRNTGGNWYKYFYDEACGWSWSTSYISNKIGSEEGKRLTVRINPNFQDKYLGAVVYGGISVFNEDAKAFGIEIYTPLHTKIKTYDTVKIDPSNIIIGGDTIFNMMGALIQAGNAEYMISNNEIIKDNKGNIIPDEIISAEIQTYGSSDFGWGNDNWDEYNKKEAMLAKWPWYSTNADDNKTLFIKNGTKIIATGRNHNCNYDGILNGTTTCAGSIELNSNKSNGNGKIELPNGSVIDVPRKTSVSVEYETGECTIKIGDGSATIIKSNGAELKIPQGAVIDNEGNIIK